MTSGICTICTAVFEYDETKRGRRRVQCSAACSNQAHRNRVSIRKQTERQASAKPCETCGGEVPVLIRGPVARWCSTFCSGVASGTRMPVPPDEIECALAECLVIFTPNRRGVRACSENHGQILWNREARADGRMKPEPWNERRKANKRKRNALKKGAPTAEAFSYQAIYDRDEWQCGICGTPVDKSLIWPHPSSVSLDHIIPLSLGGAHEPDNAQCAHLSCNVRKGVRVA